MGHDRSKRSFDALLRDRGGNISIMFALMIIPILGVTGLAVDFGRALTVKHRLAAAADAAAVGAIAEKSPAAQAATTMNNDGTIKDGNDDAQQLLNVNLINLVDAGDVTFGINVAKSGNTLSSKITYTANVPTTLARLFGKSTYQVEGQATAEHQIAQYQDYYILIDNTPSMGVAATTDGIQKMIEKTADQPDANSRSCAFACHQDNLKYDNYAVAKKFDVSMRIDTVRQATQSLTDTATASRAVPDQFRMGVYTFGAKAEAATLTTVSNLSTNLSQVKSKANDVDLMTIPSAGYNNDQLTDFDAVFSGMNNLIDTPGDGMSPAKAQKILFLVSDGVGDASKQYACTKKLAGTTRCQEPLDVRLCKPLKDRGIKIAVLYTTYLPLPNNGWYNQWIKPFQSEIATQMQSCATPGLFYEVSPSQGISEAMNALFVKAIRTVRLSS